MTEAQFPLEKYDTDDAIFHASVMCVIFVQIFVRSFSQRKAPEFSHERVQYTIETTLGGGGFGAETEKKKVQLENNITKKKTKMVAPKSPSHREAFPLKDLRMEDVILLEKEEEDDDDDEIIFVGSKEGKGRNFRRRNEEEDDEVIICGERGGGKGKQQKQERREEGRRRRKSCNEEEVIVVGEKESTQIRQARELLERHNRSNTKKKRKSSEGGSDANASPTGTRLSARKKKKATSSSPTKVPRNEPSPTPEPKGPQPKKTPKCVICLDEIEKPTATKCGHVYCDQCIRELIRAQKTKSRCPQCRKKVGLSGLTKLILDD